MPDRSAHVTGARAPLRVAGAGAITFAVAGALAARRPLPRWDHDAVRRALELSGRFDLPLRVGMQFGTVAVAIVLAVLVLVVQRSLGRSAAVVVAALAARQLAEVAKDLWDRPRPGAAYPDLVPRLFEAGHGFPSAHAAVAAAVAVAIAAGASRVWWAALGALAIVVACARVYFGVHFVLDVVGGLALGTIVGGLVVAAERSATGRFASALAA